MTMSSTVVCSYPRSRNSWKAAATSASRMGGFAVVVSEVSPRGSSLMDGT
nr:hypothetical protein [Streptomyces sp. S1D4-11]